MIDYRLTTDPQPARKSAKNVPHEPALRGQVILQKPLLDSSLLSAQRYNLLLPQKTASEGCFACIMAEPKPDPNQRPYKPETEFIVNDLETLRVLADPLRLQIVELITQAPRTVKQVAAVLNMPPTKLYYHIKQLEEHALIRVVDTRIVSGIIEKQYQATANHYRVNRELFSLTSHAGKESLNVMLTGLFDDTREDIQASVEAEVLDVSPDDSDDKPPHRRLFITRHVLRLQPSQVEEFQDKLRHLVREYAEALPPDMDDPAYSLLVLLYPSAATIPLGDDILRANP